MARNIAPSFGRVNEDDFSEQSSVEGGLFMTAINETVAEKGGAQRQTKTTSLHDKLVSSVRVIDICAFIM